MRNRAKGIRNSWKKLFLTTAAIVVLAVAVLLGLIIAPSLRAQAPSSQPQTPQWQIAAGGKMAFDVASVKLNKSSDPTYSNFPLGMGDVYSPNGGLFTATNFPLITYITFAYKLNANQTALLAQLPKWVTTDNFDIQARAEGNPTKDQMRLMMQSLLADRFKLTIHNETRQLPVFGLVLVKPGKAGPQIRPHPIAASCALAPRGDLGPPAPPPPAAPSPASAPPATFAAGLPPNCGGILGMPGSVLGRAHMGGRNVTTGLIANALTGGFTGVDRPVLDRTGLSGTFDFFVEWTPQINGSPPPNFQPDPTGPTFLEALKEQLGLKLESQTGPVDVLVIDHVEQPSEN